MLKFENIDILETLKEIMKVNIKFYQYNFESDKELLFESDKELLIKLAKNANELSSSDKTYLWMLSMFKPQWTWCLKERNILLKDTFEYSMLTLYEKETQNKIFTYLVDIKEMKGNTVTGNLYELEYHKYVEHIKEIAIPVSKIIYFYENGYRIKSNQECCVHYERDKSLGEFLYFRNDPDNLDDLDRLLETEKNIRENFCSGNIQQHIKKLSNRQDTNTIE